MCQRRLAAGGVRAPRPTGMSRLAGRWELGCVNPSVTAAPCHLPLRTGRTAMDCSGRQRAVEIEDFPTAGRGSFGVATAIYTREAWDVTNARNPIHSRRIGFRVHRERCIEKKHRIPIPLIYGDRDSFAQTAPAMYHWRLAAGGVKAPRPTAMRNLSSNFPRTRRKKSDP